ncbi:hypothetical protein AB4Y44_25450 [Paraburkholderia sp. BR10937]|uniref:hypothetical protein n=1 Tax=Paraburkholderia sp. BR10937 TaxID=3236994 RepID=UPI0034D38EE5
MKASCVAFLACASNYLAPNYVFDALLAGTGAIALLVYPVVTVSQLRLHRTLAAEGRLKLKMWLHPFPGLVVVALIAGAFGVMLCSEDHRREVVATPGCSAALAAFGYVRQQRRRVRAHVAGAGVAGRT